MTLSISDENSTVSILSPSAKLDSASYQCVAKSEVGWSVSQTDVLVQTETNYAKGEISAGFLLP